MFTQLTIEIEMKVEFSFSKGFPAYISGPPEDCYPGEADEIEIESALIYRPNPKFGFSQPGETEFIAMDLLPFLNDAQKADIEDQILSERETI